MGNAPLMGQGVAEHNKTTSFEQAQPKRNTWHHDPTTKPKNMQDTTSWRLLVPGPMYNDVLALFPGAAAINSARIHHASPRKSQNEFGGAQPIWRRAPRPGRACNDTALVRFRGEAPPPPPQGESPSCEQGVHICSGGGLLGFLSRERRRPHQGRPAASCT